MIKIICAVLTLICSSMTFGGDSILLTEALLKGSKLGCRNGELLPLARGGYRLTIPQGVTECKIDIPIVISDWTIYNNLELGITTSNKNTTVIVETFLAQPPNSLLLKETFKLNSKRSKYNIRLKTGGMPCKVKSLRISFYNKQDNSHIPESSIEHPINLNFMRLVTYKSEINKLNAISEEIYSTPRYDNLSSEAKKIAEEGQMKLKGQVNLLRSDLNFQHLTAVQKRERLQQWHQLNRKALWGTEFAVLKSLCKKNPVIYGCTGGADKIFRQRAFPGNFLDKAQISLAQNETEACQIALFATHDVNEISVSCDGLVDGKGNRFSAKQINIIPVGYVNTKKPCYYTTYYGWTPDPLLTYLKKFDLEANNYQPVWIDVAAGADQPAGVYRGKINFYVKSKKLVTVPLEVEVWDFRLPNKMTFPTAISNNTLHKKFGSFYCQDSDILKEYVDFVYSGRKDTQNLSPQAKRLLEIRNQTVRLLKRHHIPDNNIYRHITKPVPAWKRDKFKEDNIPFCMGYVLSANPKYILKVIKPQVVAMEKDGTLEQAYVYGYDEIRTKKQFQDMKRVYGAIKKNYPKLTLMATALDYSFGEKTNTKGELDVWIAPSPNYMHARDAAKRARARGKKVWWYTCNWPFPPYANFLIDTPATSHRLLMGFMPWKFDVDGFLYYETMMWRKSVPDNNRLGGWKTFGNAKIKSIGACGYDSIIEANTSGSETRATTSAQTKRSGVWQWKSLNQKMPKPIVISAESRVEKLTDGKPEGYAISNYIKYKDGTKDHIVWPGFDSKVKGWQRLEYKFTPKKPIKTVSIFLQINKRIGTVFFRNASIMEKGNQRNILRGWNTFGNVKITKGVQRSGVWQWKSLNQKMPKPIVISAESRVEKLTDGKPEGYAISNYIKYKDGTKDHIVWPGFDSKVKGWQRLEYKFTPKKPIKTVSIFLQINKRIGAVFFRNASIVQEGDNRWRASWWREPIIGGPLTNLDGRSYGKHNGDGSLLYPAVDRTVPTIRLKCLRDGLEDYEYLVMLRSAYKKVKAGKIDPVNRHKWLMKAEKCLQIDDKLVKSIYAYAQNGSVLLKHRKQIGELLSNLSEED